MGLLTRSDLERVAETSKTEIAGAIMTIREIADEVAWASGIPVDVILSDSRKRQHVALRRIIMFRAHMEGLSCAKIGRAMLMDHSTVIEGLRVERAARAKMEKETNHDDED